MQYLVRILSVDHTDVPPAKTTVSTRLLQATGEEAQLLQELANNLDPDIDYEIEIIPTPLQACGPREIARIIENLNDGVLTDYWRNP